jgi:ADP-dependent NAD(P)H-hydrate dehydratase / NAD(P)H-hydrate epimerase
MKLVTADQMRSLEQRANSEGNTYAMMMERAGKAVADAVIAHRGAADQHVLVLVGPGNNGGDGLVCARYLHDAGAIVSLYVWKRAEKADDSNWRMCIERKIQVTRTEQDADFSQLKRSLTQCEIVIDALLGTGVTRPIEGTLKELLQIISKETKEESHGLAPLLPRASAPSRPFIVAVDLPSGLNPDTGEVDPATVNADLTVTFAFPKVGQLLFPGASSIGELVVADIGIPKEWPGEKDRAVESPQEVAVAPEIAVLLPERAADSHKGTYGKTLICAGSKNYVGAVFLAGSAATRVGAGLVTLALARTIYPMIASALHETTFIVLPDEDGALGPEAANEVIGNLADYTALLVGCGFGRDQKTISFVQTLIEKVGSSTPRRKLVIDADALFALAKTPNWWTRLAPNQCIVTPHPGEMATLTGLSSRQVQADRLGVARKYAALWEQVVVLKGAHTIVADPDGRATMLPFATPALATAGTGDVLAGAIVGMLTQGLGEYDAALVGGYVHGEAGEIAQREIGDAGVVAGDLLPRLPRAISQIKRAG